MATMESLGSCVTTSK